MKYSDCKHTEQVEVVKDTYEVLFVGTCKTIAVKCKWCGRTLAIRKEVDVRVGAAPAPLVP